MLRYVNKKIIGRRLGRGMWEIDGRPSRGIVTVVSCPAENRRETTRQIKPICICIYIYWCMYMYYNVTGQRLIQRVETEAGSCRFSGGIERARWSSTHANISTIPTRKKPRIVTTCSINNANYDLLFVNDFEHTYADREYWKTRTL